MLRKLSKVVIFMIAIVLAMPSMVGAAASEAQPSIRWAKANLGSEKPIRAMAYDGKGLYVAIGDEIVKTSKDGLRWEKHPLEVSLRTAFATEIYSVAYGRDAFVAVGTEGIILKSKDGHKWNLIDSGLGKAVRGGDNDLYSIAWDGEHFWAVGANGLVVTSSDGETWTVLPYERIAGRHADEPWHFYEIQFLNGRYHIVGGKIWEIGVILQSDDGEHWNVVEKRQGDAYEAIAYNGKTYVASGGSGVTAYSTDGLQWTPSRENLPIMWTYDVVWNGDSFFLSGEGAVVRNNNATISTFRSNDGISWTPLEQPVVLYPATNRTEYPTVLAGLLYDGERLLAINEKNEVLTSTNLHRWSTSDPNAQAQAVHGNMIRYAGGKYFIASAYISSPFLISEDGERWTPMNRRMSEDIGFDEFRISDVTWTGADFLASGIVWDQGWKHYTFRSTDGYAWTASPIVIEGLKPEEYEWLNIHAIQYLGGRLVLFGEYYTVTAGRADESVGLVATTSDGKLWTKSGHSFLNHSFYGMAYGNGTYVVTAAKSERVSPNLTTSQGSIIYTSSDLKQWSVVYERPLGTLNQVHWNGQQFIASGFDGYRSRFLVSADAERWAEHSFPYPEVSFPKQVAWNGSYYLGVGNTGRVVYSADGTSWQRAEFPNYTEDMSSIVWDGKKFITGGDHAVFYGTPEITAVDRANALQQAGLLQGGSNGFELERSPNRLEAAVMLVRLLGKEAEAAEEKQDHPFTDVPDWADPYVGYLYRQGLIQGIGPTVFGASQTADLRSFSTLILRTLGYDDTAGDFQFTRSAAFASELGIVPDGHLQPGADGAFLREHMTDMAFRALFTEIKDTRQLLVDKLLTENVITQEARKRLAATLD